MTQTLLRTPLYQMHVNLGARLVPFAGWEMPLQYTSILGEVREVRTNAGVFDVSHMGRLYLSGDDASGLLEWVCTNRVGTLAEGRGRYSLVCNEEGGIIDDVIYYRLPGGRWLLVCNAANRPTVVAWLERWRRDRFPRVEVDDATERTAMVALQGPNAAANVDWLSPDNLPELRPFGCKEARAVGARVFASRTGYTGEDGFELIMEAKDDPAHMWRALIEFGSYGALPCGLGARDVLRLEAGLCLHGNDIGPTTSPLEAGLERFVKMEEGGFCGHGALVRQQQEGLRRRLVGLVVQGRSIPRQGYPIVVGGQEAGVVTSGTYSPTLGQNIGMGYVPVDAAAPGTALQVNARGTLVDAQVVTLPFYTRKRPA